MTYAIETTYEEFLKLEQEKYPELNLEDIEALKELVDANKNLPPVKDKEIVMFLHSAFFDVKKAYKTLVANYKYRSELTQIFSNTDPMSEEMKEVYETMSLSIVTVPYKGKHERYVYTQFKNEDPNVFNYVNSVKYFFMMMEVLIIQHGTFDGVILTMNGKGLNWRHLTKIPMKLAKNLMGFVQEALPVRLKEVHVINAGSISTMLFNLMKPFMWGNFLDRVTLYSEGSDEFFNHVPVEFMPEEMGGRGKSHMTYSEDTYNHMCSYRDWYTTKNN
ncbi:alpha-tocopherol transfer protein-like isoform X4 [Adelges cooleyi]|uniref:alpha-tocopherol transfer protein-like isoform X4 n=1 Tax=Adelges cooleyi TaxID=133065 RepID=UPI00217F2326|nr:alpha-tocopherol transfer protein-like isoform X4 [Adelges cooleyi]XP_050433948.1 alpha-tocopherol transfer protein-like isoform X4 [Adelges cooleyi]XP_050433949.1 alpha-tocopherol transfer protein-like isoform X4 [Adelges cooleyi]